MTVTTTLARVDELRQLRQRASDETLSTRWHQGRPEERFESVVEVYSQRGLEDTDSMDVGSWCAHGVAVLVVAAFNAMPALVGSGTYRVGVDVQPGFYVSERQTAFDGCYRERADAAGNIIDNNFATSAFRVEVTIAASDLSFIAEGWCT